MPRAFRIPASILIASAFFLLIIVSISLPYVTTVDFVRVDTGDTDCNQLRLGIWGYCCHVYGDTTCYSTGPDYSLSTQYIYVDSSWTTGLVVHPIACILSFIALSFSFSEGITFMLVATLSTFLAAALALAAFAVDIALGINSNNGGSSSPGPGFWLTLVATIFLIVAGFTTCLGRRRDLKATAASSKPSTKTSFFKRLSGSSQNQEPA